MLKKTSKDELAEALLFPPVIVTMICIIKALTAGYIYPRQDLIIYTTFLYARINPERFARDVFAGLKDTHFDFFWYLAPYLPDIWLDGDIMKNVTVVVWIFLFCSMYVLTSLFTKSMLLRLVPVLFLGWSKVTAGRMALLEYSFSHRQICYGCCFLGLWLLFNERRTAAIALMSLAALFYPPLLYYFFIPLGIFLLYEFGWKETLKYAALSAAICSPLILFYVKSGVAASLVGSSASLEWKKYLLINFDSLFSFFPITQDKLFFIASWIGCTLLVGLLWLLRGRLTELQLKYTRLLTAFLLYSVVGMILCYAGVGFAVRLQLLRAAVIAAMLTIVSFGFLLEIFWPERRRLEKFCAVGSFLSYHFMVIFAAFLNYIYPSKSALRYVIAILIFLAVDQTNAVFSSLPIRTQFSPWKDVAEYALHETEANSLIMVPPVSNLAYCNTDDQISFRLLAKRSTTLKVSDGVEIGYDIGFAAAYIDYFEDLRRFFKFEFNFSSDCAFRERIKSAWNRGGLKQQLAFSRKYGANYLLISNHLLPKQRSPQLVFEG
ncbi:MAG: hypothetical protein KDD66_05780, partial [Bdellovibrionales bacterium]|nr:hypothetical protein [Bdellovibrionales bacterium]